MSANVHNLMYSWYGSKIDILTIKPYLLIYTKKLHAIILLSFYFYDDDEVTSQQYRKSLKKTTCKKNGQNQASEIIYTCLASQYCKFNVQL